jgi:hypothetical protein
MTRLPRRETPRIHNRWKGYSVEDCDCKYCLYYLGKKNGEVNCALEHCDCIQELLEANRAGRFKAVWK